MPANMPAANTLARHGESRVLMSYNTTARQPCKSRRVPSESRRDLELLCDTDIDEPAGAVVSEARITNRVAAFTEGLRRILIKQIVASYRDAEAVQRSLPDRQAGGGRDTCRSLAILGITAHRLFLSVIKFVRSLEVEEDPLAHIMIRTVWRKFFESLDEMNGPDDVEAVPGPVEAGVGLPSVVTLIRGAFVGSSA